jgi:transposase
MRQVGEVLRLNAQGFSYRRIGQSVGISASTVQGYLERAQQAGLSWPLPDELDDAAIEALLFKRSEEELRPVGLSRTGWRCTATTSAASTSPCSCCISNTRRLIQTA